MSHSTHVGFSDPVAGWSGPCTMVPRLGDFRLPCVGPVSFQSLAFGVGHSLALASSPIRLVRPSFRRSRTVPLLVSYSSPVVGLQSCAVGVGHMVFATAVTKSSPPLPGRVALA